MSYTKEKARLRIAKLAEDFRAHDDILGILNSKLTTTEHGPYPLSAISHHLIFLLTRV